MRYLVFIAAIMILPAFGQSQTTGFRGKRFAVKANLISGVRLRNLSMDLEYVTGRNTSLTMELGAQQYVPRFQLDESGFAATPSSVSPTNTVFMNVGFRRYRNRVIPAPQGFYWSMEFGIGYEQHDFEYDGSVLNPEDIKTKRAASIYAKGSFPTFGYQSVVGKRLLVDFKFANEVYLTYYEPLIDYNFVSPNLVGFGYGRFVIGPAFYFKLGILI